MSTIKGKRRMTFTADLNVPAETGTPGEQMVKMVRELQRKEGLSFDATSKRVKNAHPELAARDRSEVWDVGKKPEKSNRPDEELVQRANKVMCEYPHMNFATAVAYVKKRDPKLAKQYYEMY